MLQWTLVVSFMLFTMGVGSRLSRHFGDRNLLETFISIEIILSLVGGSVTILVYFFFAVFGYTSVLIYLLCGVLGVLIGMEIPIAMRINQTRERLRKNVSSLLEFDYYGSLAGGIFFAFVGLPYLGVTYSPLIFGSINLLVALVLLFTQDETIQVRRKKRLGLYGILVLIILALNAIFIQNIIAFGDRLRYGGHILFQKEGRLQKITMTMDSDNFCLFLNHHKQFCSQDEVLYHEPLVHPVMTACPNPRQVLIIGGGDGMALREVLKHAQVDRVRVVDLDPNMVACGKDHPIMSSLNSFAFHDPRVEVVYQDGFSYMAQDTQTYDVILIDLPDPASVDLSRLYSYEFYRLCRRSLSVDGFMITQAGSPYYAPKSFSCIKKTMEKAGFGTLPLHNAIPSMGEWSWIVGVPGPEGDLKCRFLALNYSHLQTRWISHEAMNRIASFPKPAQSYQSKLNRLHRPVLHRYYKDGRWDLY